MHTGNVFQAEEDFLGLAVVWRRGSRAWRKGGEILVSSACREYTPQLGRWRFGTPTDVHMKGIVQVQRVFPLEWVAA